jgi:hypothetical protein
MIVVGAAAAGAGRSAARFGGGGAERFIHDASDGAHAASALGAAAQAAIDLAGPARRRGGDGSADILVGQDVAGTDNHEIASP